MKKNELMNRKTNRANLLCTFKLYSHEINNPIIVLQTNFVSSL